MAMTASAHKYSGQSEAMKLGKTDQVMQPTRAKAVSKNSDSKMPIQNPVQMKMIGKSLSSLKAGEIIDNDMIINPGIPTEDWIMEGYLADAYSFSYQEGMPVKYASDGKNMYLLDIIPGNNMQAYIKGSIAEDGKTVTFPMEQLVYIMGDPEEDPYVYEFYFVANKCTVVDGKIVYDAEENEDGSLSFNWTDAVGEIRDDGSIIFKDYLLAIWSFDLDGFVSYIFEPAISALGDNVTSQPESLNDACNYALYYKSMAYGTEPAKMSNVGFREENGKQYIYVNNLITSSPECYVRGELDGNTALFKSQYVFDAKLNRYVELFPANNIRIEQVWDEEWEQYRSFLSLDEIESAELIIDRDNGTLTLAEGFGLCDFYDGTIADVKTNLHCKKYDGDKPAIPSAPYELEYSLRIDENTGLWTVSAFGFTLWNKDINGNYINPDHLGWEVLKDGEIFTFSTDFYWELPEDTTIIPYGYSDYDFLFWGEYGAIALTWAYEPFSEWGVRAVYTVDGQTNYSEWLSIDAQTVGFNRIDIPEKIISNKVYYNLDGLESSYPFRNTVNVVKIIYEDGTIAIDKQIF